MNRIICFGAGYKYRFKFKDLDVLDQLTKWPSEETENKTTFGGFSIQESVS